MDYAKGKIYKLLNNIDDDVYVGSTCQSLSQRMAKHRSKVNTYTTPIYKKMRELGVQHFYIELIDECPCDNIEQLRSIEGKYIREYGTINKRIEKRTDKQYREDNKECIRQYAEEYRLNNREKQKQYSHLHYKNNADDLKTKHKAYRDQHKEDESKRTAVKISCECGSIHRHGDTAKHLRTAKHKRYLTTL